MKKYLAAFILLFFSFSVLAAGPQDLIRRADSAYLLRQNIKFAEENVFFLRQALQSDPENYEAAWKLARGLYYVAKAKPDEALKYNQLGEEAAKKAVGINSEGWEARLWLGICMGRVGEERGVLNSLFLVDPIKSEMEKVISINPNEDTAYYVLSVLYRKAPGWPLSIGDSNKSLQYAHKAVELSPQRHANHLALAEAWLAKGNKEKAKEHLLKVAGLPLEPDRIPEGEEDQLTASKILASLK
jgi:hypothetical protein